MTRSATDSFENALVADPGCRQLHQLLVAPQRVRPGAVFFWKKLRIAAIRVKRPSLPAVAEAYV